MGSWIELVTQQWGLALQHAVDQDLRAADLADDADGAVPLSQDALGERELDGLELAVFDVDGLLGGGHPCLAGLHQVAPLHQAGHLHRRLAPGGAVHQDLDPLVAGEDHQRAAGPGHGLRVRLELQGDLDGLAPHHRGLLARGDVPLGPRLHHVPAG